MNLLAMLQSVAATPPPPPEYMLRLSEVFLILFVTLGPPLKTPAVFLQATQQVTPPDARAIAVKAFVFALVALLIGGFVGGFIARNWHIAPGTLLLAAGVIFFLVSLQQVLGQFQAATPVPAAPAAPSGALPSAFRIAVPMIVTPYGLAALILLLGNSADTGRTLAILGLLVVVLVLHLLAMLFARPIMRTIGPIPLQLFGVIMGVLTVALSLQLVLTALDQLGLFAGVGP